MRKKPWSSEEPPDASERSEQSEAGEEPAEGTEVWIVTPVPPPDAMDGAYAPIALPSPLPHETSGAPRSRRERAPRPPRIEVVPEKSGALRRGVYTKKPRMPARRTFELLLLAGALAAGVGLMADIITAPPERLPSYELIALVDGHAVPSRGDLVVDSDASLQLVLRPDRAVEGPLEVRSFLLAGGELEEWPLSFRTGRDGEIRTTKPVSVGSDVLARGRGETSMVFAIGRRGDAPGPAEVRRALEERGSPQKAAHPPRGWQLIRRDVRAGSEEPSKPRVG